MEWLAIQSPLLLVPLLVISLLIANGLAWWGEHLRLKRVHQKINELGVSQGPAIGVSLVCGFLGSGKTTMLNHILCANHGKRIAIVENEIGSIGIDHHLIAKELPAEKIFLLKNGCMCCSTDGSTNQLERVLDRLVRLDQQGRHTVDYVLVESTGLADPAPIIQALWEAESVKGGFRMDAVLTVVDCSNVQRHLAGGLFSKMSECVTQIAHADVIILNKTDLVDQSKLKEVDTILNELSPLAHRHHSSYGRVPIEHLIDIATFSKDTFDRITRMNSREHKHRRYAQPITLCAGQLDWEKTRSWLTKLANECGDKLLRVKGLLEFKDKSSWVVQGVHHQMQMHQEPGIEAKGSVLLCVGVGLDVPKLQREFDACCCVKPTVTSRIRYQSRHKLAQIREIRK